MDKYKHIVETTAKRVAAKIKEERLQNKQASNLREGNIHYEGLLEAVSDFTLKFLQGWHEEAKVELRQEIEANGFDISDVIMQSLGGGTPPMYDRGEEVKELDEKRRVRTGGEDRARGDIQPDRIREGEEEEEELEEGNGHPMVDQMKADCEERGGTWKGGDGCVGGEKKHEYSGGARANAAAGAEFTGRSEIKESNDQWYQRNLFENLIKKWAK